MTPVARALRIALPILLLAAVGCVQVTGTTPRDACPGEQTVIAGSGFGATQGSSSVTFGTTTASISSWSDTAITASVPAAVAGVVNVVVHTPGGASTALPFRAIECPVAGAVGSPQLAVSPSGAPHVVVGQGGFLEYLTKSGGSWSSPETVDTLAGDYAIAVTADGRPNVVYAVGPSTQNNHPGMHRYRDSSGWSPAVTACNDNSNFPLFGSCGGIRLVAPSDNSLAVFSRSGDRYGSTWAVRRDYDGTSWGGASIVDYASVGTGYIQDARAAAGFGTWHATVHRNEFNFSTNQSTYRVSHVAPGGNDTLASVINADPYSTPTAAASLNRMHFAWRDGSNLVHRYRDMSTGTYSAQVTIAAVTGSPSPVVAADPVGDDGAFAVWLEGGQLKGSIFNASTGTWGAPVLVASNAGGAPVAEARAGVTHIAWTGTAGDLRYTTLP